jgi:hypothetical protein
MLSASSKHSKKDLMLYTIVSHLVSNSKSSLAFESAALAEKLLNDLLKTTEGF